jgi:hypothetical protein
MTKIKVKELIALFDNTTYPKPIELQVCDTKKDKYVMDCSFYSWKNIRESILNADVVCCDVSSKVLRIECEV